MTQYGFKSSVRGRASMSGENGFILKTIGTVLGIFIGIPLLITLVCLLAFIPAGLWYCFDDALAAATNLEGLGNVPFWNVFAFTIFVALLTKSSSVSKSSDN